MPKMSIQDKFVSIPDTEYAIGCDNYGWIIRKFIKTKDSNGNDTGNIRFIDTYPGTFARCLTKLSELILMKSTQESKVVTEIFDKWENSFLKVLDKIKEIAPLFKDINKKGEIIDNFKEDVPKKAVPKVLDAKINSLLSKFEEVDDE